jgi:N-acetylmuramoyl-L-alanine amidase
MAGFHQPFLSNAGYSRPVRPSTTLLVTFIITAVCLSAAEPKTSKINLVSPNPWQIIKIDGGDYLTVDNIAKFYGLPTGALVVDKKIELENEKASLTFTLNSREVFINGARNWLSFPVIEKDGQFLVSRNDLIETIEPQLRPHMISNLRKIRTAVLDPGHGGHDKGATSRYGCEKDFALDVARQLRPLLQAQGFKVILTREADYFVPLEMRASIANAAPDAIFVSIHFNAADANPRATGFEIYSLTPRGAPSTHEDFLKASANLMQNGTPVETQSIELSACIYHSVLGHIAEFDRGIKRARFAVLRRTKVPAVLIEGGFMTENGESKLIADKTWRGQLAEAISIGIDSYRRLADRKERPLLVRDYPRKAPPLFMDGGLPRDMVASPAPAGTPQQKPAPGSLESAVIVP